jgi:hypothetical protein
MFERLAAVLFYPLFLGVVWTFATRVAGIREGFLLSLGALAWFVFVRLLVNVYSCALGRGVTRSHRPALLAGSVIIDGTGIYATLHIDSDLIWTTVAAIAISEGLIWSLEFVQSRPSPQ